MTSYFMQKSAFLHTSISFVETKSFCQCDSDDLKDICVIVIVTFSETDK